MPFNSIYCHQEWAGWAARRGKKSIHAKQRAELRKNTSTQNTIDSLFDYEQDLSELEKRNVRKVSALYIQLIQMLLKMKVVGEDFLIWKSSSPTYAFKENKVRSSS